MLTAHTTETTQIVAAIEKMSATANDVASNASEASQFTHNTNTQVTDSKNVVTGATKTISQLVEEVENTSHVANDLDTIAQSVTHINDLNTQIATPAEQQSSVADEITRNMAAIREIVGELSANEEATAHETINLAAANSQLKSVVGKFRLQ